MNFKKAVKEFQRVFMAQPETAGTAGWQANADSLRAYDEARLLYGSDVRGTTPFIPRVGNHVFKTLQIPTTLPTLDELMGRPEYPFENLIAHYHQLLKADELNVLTIHAELEGMRYLSWFREFLQSLKTHSTSTIEVVRLDRFAQQLLANRSSIPVCDMIQGTVDGRSGTLAVQAATTTTQASSSTPLAEDNLSAAAYALASRDEIACL